MAGGIGTPGPPAKRLMDIMARLHVADEQLGGYTERMNQSADPKEPAGKSLVGSFVADFDLTVDRIEQSVSRLLELL